MKWTRIRPRFAVKLLMQVVEDLESLHVKDLVVKGGLSGVDTRFIKVLIAEALAAKKERTISRTPRWVHCLIARSHI